MRTSPVTNSTLARVSAAPRIDAGTMKYPSVVNARAVPEIATRDQTSENPSEISWVFSLPNSYWARRWSFSAGREKSPMAPLIARSPKMLVAAPREISARPISTGTNCVQSTQPPKGSLAGMPSQRTRVRLAPEDPMPRSEIPCVVGLAARLDERRNRLNPGTSRSRSSRFVPGLCCRAVLSSVVTLAGGSAERAPARDVAEPVVQVRSGTLLQGGAIQRGHLGGGFGGDVFDYGDGGFDGLRLRRSLGRRSLGLRCQQERAEHQGPAGAPPSNRRRGTRGAME